MRSVHFDWLADKGKSGTLREFAAGKKILPLFFRSGARRIGTKVGRDLLREVKYERVTSEVWIDAREPENETGRESGSYGTDGGRINACVCRNTEAVEPQISEGG